MKRFFLSLIAIIFPWLLFFIYDNPGAGLAALVLQATGIGWLPASIWAWRTLHDELKKKKSHPLGAQKKTGSKD